MRVVVHPGARFLALAFSLALAVVSNPARAQDCQVLQTRIPADIPVRNAEADASTFQKFGWDSFLGLNAPAAGTPPATATQTPQWRDWSSSIDMLTCLGDVQDPQPAGCECPGGDCEASGTRYYPTACRAIPGYQDYRAIGQLAQIDDSFLQADTRGLTNNPVLDRNGRFLRFEILLSPATYSNIVSERLWDSEQLAARDAPPTLYCGLPSYTGGDPAHRDMGGIVLKAAWMDVSGDAAPPDPENYYTEDLLIYSPAYRNASGIESCELRTMALAGFHIIHKTARQPAWVWTTFEHRDFAPNCSEQMPAPIPPPGRCKPELPLLLMRRTRPVTAPPATRTTPLAPAAM